MGVVFRLLGYCKLHIEGINKRADAELGKLNDYDLGRLHAYKDIENHINCMVDAWYKESKDG